MLSICCDGSLSKNRRPVDEARSDRARRDAAQAAREPAQEREATLEEEHVAVGQEKRGP